MNKSSRESIMDKIIGEIFDTANRDIDSALDAALKKILPIKDAEDCDCEHCDDTDCKHNPGNKEEETVTEDLGALTPEEIQSFTIMKATSMMMEPAKANVISAIEKYNKAAKVANKAAANFWESLADKRGLDNTKDALRINKDTMHLERNNKKSKREKVASDTEGNDQEPAVRKH